MIEIEGPVWDNGCGHKDDEYVGSFIIVGSLGDQEKYDLYVYTDKASGNAHGCLRYGNEGHEYLSPGCVTRMFQNTALPSYRAACEMLRNEGRFGWTKKS